jgi:hypothetical protein
MHAAKRRAVADNYPQVARRRSFVALDTQEQSMNIALQ